MTVKEYQYKCLVTHESVHVQEANTNGSCKFFNPGFLFWGHANFSCFGRNRIELESRSSQQIINPPAGAEADNDQYDQRYQPAETCHFLAAGKADNHENQHHQPMKDQRDHINDQKSIAN